MFCWWNSERETFQTPHVGVKFSAVLKELNFPLGREATAELITEAFCTSALVTEYKTFMLLRQDFYFNW